MVEEMRSFQFESSFEDQLVLESVQTSELGGDEARAERGAGAGQIVYPAASINGELGYFEYGKFPSPNGGVVDACCVPLKLSVRSVSSFRIEEVKVECCVGRSESSQNVAHPRILDYFPPEIRDSQATKVKIFKGFEVNPQISAPMGSLSLGSYNNQHSYTVESFWRFTATRLKRHFPQDMVRVTANANRYQKEGLTQQMYIFLLIDHLSEPFYIDFTITTLKVNFSQRYRLLLPANRRFTARRHFSAHGNT